MFKISLLLAAFLSTAALSQTGGPQYPVYVEATKSSGITDRVTGQPLPEPTGAWAYDLSIRNENNRTVYCPNASFVAHLDFYLNQCGNPKSFGHSIKFGNNKGGLLLPAGQRISFAKAGDNERHARELELGGQRLEYCDRDATPLDCGFNCENGRLYGDSWTQSINAEGYKKFFCAKNGVAVNTEIFCDKIHKPGDVWTDKYFVNGKKTFYCRPDGLIDEETVCDDGTNSCIPTSTCPSGTSDVSHLYPKGLPGQKDPANRPACRLSGTIKGHVLLTADHVYELHGSVTIGDDLSESSLTIKPGTTIRGSNEGSALVIARRSKIFASGTVENPIVFAGYSAQGTQAGRWRGLIINGRSTLNICVQGSSACNIKSVYGYSYGGNVANDSSGTLSYVNILGAGAFPPTASAPELGGLTLNAVGSGTKIDHIQVQHSATDGVSILGGTVNFKHLVIDGFYQDGLDWDLGWTGKAQYVLIKSYGPGGVHGIKGTNALMHNRNLLPRSNPTLANFTIMSDSVGYGTGLFLSAGSGATLYNSIVTGFRQGCLGIHGAETFAANAIRMEGVVAKCDKTFNEQPGDPFLLSELFAKSGLNIVADPMMSGYAVDDHNSPSLYTFIDLPRDDFFTEYFFAGAVEVLTGKSADWTRGWTRDPQGIYTNP